jgi:hypothetical protein
MMCRRFLIQKLGACLVVALCSQVVHAQMSSGGGAPTTTTTPAGGGGGQSQTARSSTISSTQTTQIMAVSSGSGSATSVPSNSNALTPWFGDPYSMGLASKYIKGPPTNPTVTFGKGNYTSTTQGATTQAGGGQATTTSTTAATNYGTQPGLVRNPQYVTVLTESVPPVVHQSGALFAEVRDVIDRSSRLQNKSAIQVNVNGDTVILSGQVASDRDRVLVESIVKMTPGVRNVDNQLQVK